MNGTDLPILAGIVASLALIGYAIVLAARDLRSDPLEKPRPLTTRRLDALDIIEPDDSTITRIYRPDQPQFPTASTVIERTQP